MDEKPIIKNITGNQSGFTLIEVMIAIAIFAIFSSVFVAGFGQNLVDSGNLKEDILLKDLAENKINEIVINPPKLDDSITLAPETKDVESNTDYQTIVTYKKFQVPDMEKITSSSVEDLNQSDQEKNQDQLQKKIFQIFKDNMEVMLWQVEVTVKNKASGDTFKLSTWLFNQGAEVKIGTF